MKVTRLLPVLIFCMSWMLSNAQVSEKTARPIPESFCISSMEYKLYNMINAYRQRYDLPPIPLSKSLCFVASTHVRDLFFHHPDQGTCNSHSWSDQGSWKPFCYPRDENKKSSVWDKPKELTPYRSKGFEIVYWENNAVVIDSIIAFWKSMDYFNSFLMNTGKWQGKKWNAIGIGIHENYACAWFGELPDPEGEPAICGQEAQITPPPPIEEPATTGTKEVKKKEPVKKPVEKNAVEKKPVKKKVVTKKPVVEPKVTEQPPEPEATIEPPVRGKEYYYIIVKGIAPEKELQRYLKDLQSKGYTDSRILAKNGKLRVSIMEFPNKSSADSALRQVKKTWLDAWILKQ